MLTMKGGRLHSFPDAAKPLGGRLCRHFNGLMPPRLISVQNLPAPGDPLYAKYVYIDTLRTNTPTPEGLG